jgi:hypothetical protein
MKKKKIVPKYILAKLLDTLNFAARAVVATAAFIVLLPFFTVGAILFFVYIVLDDLNNRAARWFDIKSTDFHADGCDCHECKKEEEEEELEDKN